MRARIFICIMHIILKLYYITYGECKHNYSLSYQLINYTQMSAMPFFLKKRGLKMGDDELINKLRNILNELIYINDLSVETTEFSNELLETLKMIENCTSCKDNTRKCDPYMMRPWLVRLKEE